MRRPADASSFEIEPGVLDPRDVVRALDQALPKDWHIVNSSGHCSYFTTHMVGRRANRFHAIREFGAIGNGLSYAIGVAAAYPDHPVVLLDGDGGLLMHAQELETVRRHNLPILLCILNDGAYGSEIHKLRADGLSDSGAVFGRGDLGSIAHGFGLAGERCEGPLEVTAARRGLCRQAARNAARFPHLRPRDVTGDATSPSGEALANRTPQKWSTKGRRRLVRSGATRAAGSAQQAARGVVREFAAAIAHEINQQLTASGNYLRVAKRAAEESPPNVKSAAEASAEAITQVDRTGALNPGDHCQPAPQWFYSLVSTSSLQKTGILLTIGRDFC